jgi:hypothetical protein
MDRGNLLSASLTASALSVAGAATALPLLAGQHSGRFQDTMSSKFQGLL